MKLYSKKETIKGRTILFEAHLKTWFPPRCEYRTLMLVDQRTVGSVGPDEFAVYRASMAVSLLKNLPDDDCDG